MERRLILIWLALLGLTLLSFESGDASRNGGGVLKAAVLAVAFFKVRIIILEFMELRDAPIALRAVVEGWTWLTMLLLIAMLGLGVWY